MNETYLLVALCTIYAASVAGVFAKFWRNRIRGWALSISLVVPFFVIILPVVILVSVYVPSFNKEWHPLIVAFRKMPRIRFVFPFSIVASSIRLLPLFTFVLARMIRERQLNGESAASENIWRQTIRQILPLMALTFQKRILMNMMGS